MTQQQNLDNNSPEAIATRLIRIEEQLNRQTQDFEDLISALQPLPERLTQMELAIVEQQKQLDNLVSALQPLPQRFNHWDEAFMKMEAQGNNHAEQLQGLRETLRYFLKRLTSFIRKKRRSKRLNTQFLRLGNLLNRSNKLLETLQTSFMDFNQRFDRAFPPQDNEVETTATETTTAIESQPPSAPETPEQPTTTSPEDSPQ